MLKLIKDSLLIAAVLILVLFLLFIANVIKGSSEPAAPPATGGAVISSGSTGIWEVLFIVLILVMLYLIYRTFRTTSFSYSIPEPTVNNIPKPVSEVKQIEPRVIAPKMYEPVYRKPLPSPVRQVYVEKPVYAEEHNDRGVHEELSNIRNLLQGKEHDIAKKRFVRLK